MTKKEEPMEATVTKIKIAEMLETLGFSEAAKRLKEMAARKRKLAIAYENYRVVRPVKIHEFIHRLKLETIKGKEPYNATWKTLDFYQIENYPNIPPDSVLETMAVAVGRQCFDSFEIAVIKDVKDPLLFGRINGCEDRFFIDQWDSDVSIKDILKDHEG